MSAREIRKLVFVLLILGILGYWREFFFTNMNNIMFRRYYNTTNEMPIPTIMSFFMKLDFMTLYYLKYPFTLLWCGIFFFAGYFTLKAFAVPRQIIKLYGYTYVLILLFAALVMSYGLFIRQKFQDDEYTLSRWLLGIAQSPIICLILVASSKLYNKSPDTDDQKR